MASPGRVIVFDASAVVSAALREDSVPERALLRAEPRDIFALSAEVDAEIAGVLDRQPSAPCAHRARPTQLDIAGSDAGGHGAAAIYSRIETAKLNGLNRGLHSRRDRTNRGHSREPRPRAVAIGCE